MRKKREKERERERERDFITSYLVELLNSQAFWPFKDEQHTSLDMDFTVKRSKKKKRKALIEYL